MLGDELNFVPHPISVDSIKKIERVMRVKFPISFVDFYLCYNGVYFLFPENLDEDVDILVYFDFDGEEYPIAGVIEMTDFCFDPYLDNSINKEANNNPFLLAYMMGNVSEKYLDKHLIAFGDDGTGCRFCVSLSDSNYGGVFYVEDAMSGLHDQIKLSSSIEEFVSNLKFRII